MVNDYTINGIFPCPVYVTKRDTNLDSTEEKEIEDIIAEGMFLDGTCGEAQDQHTDNTYIFNTNLKNLKEFCEEHIKNYVKKIIVPKNEELDFYITQSWLNVVEPGGEIYPHWHANSIISGTFYLTVEEDDTIKFNDPFWKYKHCMEMDNREFNLWNSMSWNFPVNSNELFLFPSWLDHKVESNEKATTNRISLSFNTFVRGPLGSRARINELILR